jgi:hypothetical protein
MVCVLSRFFLCTVLKTSAGRGGLSRTLQGRMGWSSVTGSKPTQTQTLVCLLPLTSYYVNTKTIPEYPFARYNAKSADYTYSQDEYTKFLEG